MPSSTQPALRLHVAAKAVEAEGVASFRLVGEPDQPLPGFSAGAHIDVHLDGGLVRQYSLCNPSQSPFAYEIAVLREPASRGGSRFMHESLAVGAEIRASRPKNHFPLAEGAPALLFAGGIGITPVLAMAQELDEGGRAFELHYCARSPSRAAFVKRLTGSAYADRVHIHYDDGPAEQRLDVGAVLGGGSAAHHLYVCGPGGFIQHVLDAARQAAWPEDRLHREFFAAPAAPAAEAAADAFEIELARSGRRLTVPADKTVLEVLTEAGVEVPASCEAGVCGTCMTRVIDGTPDHRDVYLTDAEHARNDCFTPCCSRSRSPRLVLDL
jgi:vanillate O-demethylase ferredoxin subunit